MLPMEVKDSKNITGRELIQRTYEELVTRYPISPEFRFNCSIPVELFDLANSDENPRRSYIIYSNASIIKTAKKRQIIAFSNFMPGPNVYNSALFLSPCPKRKKDETLKELVQSSLFKVKHFSGILILYTNTGELRFKEFYRPSKFLYDQLREHKEKFSLYHFSRKRLSTGGVNINLTRINPNKNPFASYKPYDPRIVDFLVDNIINYTKVIKNGKTK